VSESSVTLDPGGEVPASTVFWTAGIAPNPFVEKLGVPLDRHGAVVVDQYLAVPGNPGLWALGDCAGIPNPKGGTYTTTAQNAEREGPVLADNILASIQGRPLRAFTYQPVGMMTALGRRRAVGQLYGRQFSGLPAWAMWRGAYLSKLPGLDRKARVAVDWLLDAVFPPDLVDTLGRPPSPGPGS
jgi:NADH dehydrogenase